MFIFFWGGVCSWASFPQDYPLTLLIDMTAQMPKNLESKNDLELGQNLRGSFLSGVVSARGGSSRVQVGGGGGVSETRLIRLTF